MQKITDELLFREHIQADRVTIALFKTEWCRDCHFLEPFMSDVIAKYGDQFQWLEMDRDDLPDLCEQLNILGIPSFIAFKNGQETVRFVSKLRKTREEIEQFLDRVLLISKALP